MECVEFDRPFATMQTCELKYVQNAGQYTIDIHTRLHKIPVTSVSINLEFMRKSLNIYRPYLYNVSVDFCKVLKNSKRFHIIKMIVQTLAYNSNVNHTCPYNHDIIMRNMALKKEMFERFPLSDGDFLLNVRVGAYNEWKAFFTYGHYKFTNVKCLEYDKPFATIPICKLKIVQRGVVAFDLHVKLHQVPVNNVSVNAELLKKANGYRPFLYNVSADFCQLMRNGKKFPFLNIFILLLAKDSNINHTCPYDHDIIVRRLVLRDDMFAVMPLPNGDYLLNIRVGAYNDWKACVKVYLKVYG
ncbi:uncharacterized protein LOC119611597 [Lucilia sericata]|uniref:uncharacterized protein LOC119611597 n=1 Tax=Lucilia sericata TaxID=13632 RepID=UPI0018A847E3|nr:uncharacterized protein LOC119611597 [Lucilia sericata]